MKTLAIFLAVAATVGFSATASLAASVTYPGNPNGERQKACEKQGRSFVQHSDGNWYCDLPVNRGALIKELEQPGIHVTSGTYGGNCGQSVGNVTDQLASTCNGKSSCAYIIDYKLIGDRAPGCQKDYVAKWTCGGGGERTARADAEAGYGSSVALACVDRSAAAQPPAQSGTAPCTAGRECDFEPTTQPIVKQGKDCRRKGDRCRTAPPPPAQHERYSAPTQQERYPDWFRALENEEMTDAVYGRQIGTDWDDEVDWIVHAAESIVYFRKPQTGQSAGTYTIVPTTRVRNAPALVRLQDNHWYAFVTASDGKLYKINVPLYGISVSHASLATTVGASQTVNLKRPTDSSCIVKDTISAGPLVVLANYSSGNNKLDKDLVIVPTHHGCDSHTTNMIYAFHAVDITQPPIWVQNQFGDHSFDYLTSCISDARRNRVICVANLQTGRDQSTVVSLDVLTGSIVWQKNVGSVHSRPALGFDTSGTIEHLYVADMSSRLHALDPSTGIEHWTLGLSGTPGVYVSKDVVSGQGQYAGLVISVMSDGKVVAVQDHGAVPGEVGDPIFWTYDPGFGVKALSRVELVSSIGKIYVGLDNGAVHQLNINGQDEAYCVVSGGACHGTAFPANTFAVSSPLFYTQESIGKLVVSFHGSGLGGIGQITVPLEP